MLGLPTISSPASRPSFKVTKKFTAARTRLTPRASVPTCGDIGPDQELGGWPQALLFGITNGSREQGKKKENAKMDDFALLRPSFYRSGGEGQLLHQWVTIALLRQFKAGGPT